jgi:hypothetical protein
VGVADGGEHAAERRRRDAAVGFRREVDGDDRGIGRQRRVAAGRAPGPEGGDVAGVFAAGALGA